LHQKRKRNHSKNRVVAPSSVPEDRRVLNFSFKYLQTDHPRFPIFNCDNGFFTALLEKLKFYEAMSVDDFVQEDFREKRHTIVWANTNEPNGFPNIDPNEIGTDTGWQFCLFGEDGKMHPLWRVHGFVLDRTFFIVWLDCNHCLIG